MPYLFAILLSALALCSAACKSGNPKAAPASKTITPKETTAVQPGDSANKPSIRPANSINGRVIAVRDGLRFVIIDFSSSRMPQLDQRLNVYRLDQRVAEVKISGPYLGTTVAADITAGEAIQGDLVRDR